MDAGPSRRHPARVRVTLLGTGTSTGIPALTCDCKVCTSDDPRDQRLRTSALLEFDGGPNLLIDSGIDTRQQLLRVGLKRLDGILQTHAHADHVLGLDDLRVFCFRQRESLNVHGNADTLSQLKRTFWYAFEKTQYEEGKPKLELIEVDGPFEAAGISITPLPIIHGSLPILGYRIGSFAYVTDALVIPDSTMELLEGLDVLVLNALRDKPHPTHHTFDDALAIISRLQPKKAYLTHVGHWLSAAEIDERSPENVGSAWDGQTFEFPEP
jgi:phosphoribosyl 1,2-cyclic phosphate phosphodiesterase